MKELFHLTWRVVLCRSSDISCCITAGCCSGAGAGGAGGADISAALQETQAWGVSVSAHVDIC